MAQPIHTTAGNHAAPKSQRGLEQYPTPARATAAMWRTEPLPHVIWEPCAGDGNIVRVLKANGHDVIANDLTTDDIVVLRAPMAVGRVFVGCDIAHHREDQSSA